jgi:hypothetical protein
LLVRSTATQGHPAGYASMVLPFHCLPAFGVSLALPAHLAEVLHCVCVIV